MLRAAVLVLLALGLAACGSSSGTPQAARIEFGIAGGNIAPYAVMISANGAVRSVGTRTVSVHDVSSSTVASLARLAGAGLRSRQCPGTFPDVAAEFVRADGRSIRVHGSCEPAFNRLYDRLVRAVGLTQG